MKSLQSFEVLPLSRLIIPGSIYYLCGWWKPTLFSDVTKIYLKRAPSGIAHISLSAWGLSYTAIIQNGECSYLRTWHSVGHIKVVKYFLSRYKMGGWAGWVHGWICRMNEWFSKWRKPIWKCVDQLSRIYETSSLFILHWAEVLQREWGVYQDAQW